MTRLLKIDGRYYNIRSGEYKKEEEPFKLLRVWATVAFDPKYVLARFVPRVSCERRPIV